MSEAKPAIPQFRGDYHESFHKWYLHFSAGYEVSLNNCPNVSRPEYELDLLRRHLEHIALRYFHTLCAQEKEPNKASRVVCRLMKRFPGKGDPHLILAEQEFANLYQGRQETVEDYIQRAHDIWTVISVRPHSYSKKSMIKKLIANLNDSFISSSVLEREDIGNLNFDNVAAIIVEKYAHKMGKI